MLPLALRQVVQRPLRILFLGAHCDDVEIGCGGTILRLAAEHSDASFAWVTFASTPERKREAEVSARSFLRGVATYSVEVNQYRESYFPFAGAELKEYFETLKRHEPDLVFTHYREDRHQDHRTISDLTWNTFRDQLVLEYEIPKFDGDLGQPNCFVPLTRETVEGKAKLLLECFPSQLRRPWFSADTFTALSRLRGIECNAPEGHAEAFYMRKAVIFGL